MSNLWNSTAPAPLDAPPAEGEIVTGTVIVGGGFTGLSAALHLAASGEDVCVLEAEHVGYGGSGRNVGLVNAGLWTPPEEVERILGAEAGARLNAALAAAPDLVFSLIGEHGIGCEAMRNGTLHCAHSRAGLGDLRARHAQLSARGAPVQLLSAGETRDRTGSPALHGALFDPRAGTIQPLAYAQGLAQAAARSGARIFERSAVVSAEHDESGWRVKTRAARVTARRLVCATNAYETRPGAAGAHTPVHFTQCATAPLPPGLRDGILPGGEGCWDTATVMSAFRLDAAGRVIIGGVGNLEGPGGAVHLGWARRKLARLFPQLAGQPFEHAWSGRIAMTADHLPKVTRIGPEAISIHGYSGRGIGPGTVFGKCVPTWAGGDDEDAFPVAIAAPRAEPFSALKSACFEAGATLVHLLGARAG